MTRSKEKELMDLGSAYYSKEEYEQCLRLLFKVNRLFGFFRQTIKLLKYFPQDAVLADVGCGGGLFLLNLHSYYPKMQMLGLDISQEAIQLAQLELKEWKRSNENIPIEFQLQTKHELSLAPDSVDVILMTLVCHHVDDEALSLFLKTAYQASRKGLIINDLHRSSIAYWFYKAVSPLLFRNRLITHDGLISIEKGFKRQELKYFLQQANIHHYRIRWHFPFRWSVLILK